MSAVRELSDIHGYLRGIPSVSDWRNAGHAFTRLVRLEAPNFGLGEPTGWPKDEGDFILDTENQPCFVDTARMLKFYRIGIGSGDRARFYFRSSVGLIYGPFVLEDGQLRAA